MHLTVAEALLPVGEFFEEAVVSKGNDDLLWAVLYPPPKFTYPHLQQHKWHLDSLHLAETAKTPFLAPLDLYS